MTVKAIRKLKRKSQIMETLTENKTMTLEQIADCVFTSIVNPKQRKDKTRFYMKELFSEHRVSKAVASDFNSQVCYWVEAKRHKSWQQQLWVNEVFRFFTKDMTELIFKSHEHVLGDLRMDGILVGKNNNKSMSVAIEIDLTGHEFDKVKKYNLEYIKGEWKKKEWAISGIFPLVMIVTHRPNEVNRLINEENIYGLKFKVVRFLDLREMTKAKTKGEKKNEKIG